MNQVLKIAQKELKSTLRDNSFLILSSIILSLLAIAIYAGYLSYSQQNQQVISAQEEKREQWEHQGDKHPHIAAHFGTFVFKPKTVLSFFDYGLDAFTGTSVYLEAHYQHEFMFRPAQDNSSMIRFGQLSAALILQVLLPLLIIFLCFSSFTGEKERGTLKLLMSQGVSLRRIAWGKILAYYGLICVLLVPVFVIIALLTQASAQVNAGDAIIRLILLTIAYAIYIFIFTCMSVLISAHFSNTRNALLTLLTLWILFTIIIPKTVANIGESTYDLPSMKIYREAIQQDIKYGLDGKSPREVRYAVLEKDYLEKYKVDSVQNLPLNFEGVAMQAGEDYGNQVYDVHWNALVQLFESQNQLSTYCSVIDPYLAIRNISMGFSATDFHTAVNFQHKVEAYRRSLVEKMNLDMAENSRYGDFYGYKASTDLWKSVSDFNYEIPSWKVVLWVYAFEIFTLLFWLIGTIFLVQFSVNKITSVHE